MIIAELLGNTTTKMNIIDFEASSLSPGYPIQVAVILENGDVYSSYINPPDKWIESNDWDPNSENVHKIPMSILREHGKDVTTVATELNAFIDGREVFCDGGLYDLQWCNRLFVTAGVTKSFMLGDIMRDLIKGPTNGVHLWAAKRVATKELGLREHDALNDVRIIQRAIEIYRDPMFIQEHSLKPFS